MPYRRTLSLGLITALTLVLAIAPSVAAHGGGKHHTSKPLPTQIDLPTGFTPEGIASGPHAKLYVGSRANGAIWKGSAKTGTGRILVPGIEGRAALGLHLDWRGRIWVAGGANKTIRVYSSSSGKLLKTYTFPTAGFLNDLVITRKGVYATDSVNPQLAVVPFGRWGAHWPKRWHSGKLPSTSKAKVLPISGDLVYETGFNANGIVAKAGWLVVVQSNTGELFRVNPWSGRSKIINTGGYSVENGDGLLLKGNHLYVVRNQNNLVALLKLNWRLTSAKKISEITSPGLDTPTTAAFAAGKLWAVNARFGVADPSTAPFWITRLPSK